MKVCLHINPHGAVLVACFLLRKLKVREFQAPKYLVLQKFFDMSRASSPRAPCQLSESSLTMEKKNVRAISLFLKDFALPKGQNEP